MAIRFRADNIGSLLRPEELLKARVALREGRMDQKTVREIEDRSILKALELQKSAGVQILKGPGACCFKNGASSGVNRPFFVSLPPTMY